MKRYLIFVLTLVIVQYAMASDKTGASQPSVLVLADMHLSKPKSELLKQSAEKYNVKLDTYTSRMFGANNEKLNLCDYDLILFEAVNKEAAASVFLPYADAIQQCDATASTQIGFHSVAQLERNINTDDAQAIEEYLSNGQRTNFENLIAYIQTHLFSNSFDYKSPIVLPQAGFYVLSSDNTSARPSIFSSINQSLEANSEKALNQNPVIIVKFHRSQIEAEQTQLINATLKQLKDLGATAIGMFYEGDLTEEFADTLKGKVHAIINYRMLHEPAKTATLYQDIGVPVIHGLIYREGNEEDFNQAQAGVSAMMSPYFLMLPESAGVIDPTIIATTDVKTKEQIPLQPHIQAISERAMNQANLQLKQNKDKKLAVLMWNYPPGEKNMGAAFLNVPQSLVAMTQSFKQNEYSIEPKQESYFIENVGKLLKPLYRQEDIEMLVSSGMADYLPVESYKNWLLSLPESIHKPILESWGNPEDHIYVRTVDGEPKFVIPRMKLGNLIVLPQPSRSDNPDQEQALYHSIDAPITHFYLAVYFYIREQFGADAIIHLGTHGSQEWLQGKERGLSVYDAPNLAVGNLPVIYPYIMDNVGEAMQAKRRGRAVMISHMTPGFAASGYYGKISELHELIQQYAALSDGSTKQKTQEAITEKVLALNILDDIHVTQASMEAEFPAFLETLHDYLHEMATEAQPLGQHTFGETLQDAHIITTLLQMLGHDFENTVKTFEQENKVEFSDEFLKAKQSWFSKKLEENKVVQLDELPGFKTLWMTLVEDQTLNMPSNLETYIEKARSLMQDFKGQREMASLLNALNGRYTQTGFGGDPIRSPEAMPTGNNLVGFNPAKVPSKAAYEVGRELVEELIANHKKEKGEYPDKLAFSLWSLETMRHHGVLESQVMAAIGVKPKWDENGIIRGTEVIPFDELKRPRVDVTISATGLYRDAFPNVMLLLANAIKEISELKEDGNSVYKNTVSLKKLMLEEGKSETEAAYFSTVRIFSNESGNYGSGLADTSLASGTWENDSKLSDVYIRRMGYGFGADEDRWSEEIDGLYAKALSGTDAVVFSRSTNLYGMITSDDPFQYFGGIGLAIRNIDGKSPEMIIANLRKRNNVKTESLKKFMARELRTRVFHPRWIEEAQKEGYAGALQMLDRINNFWGWTVMHPESVTDAQWQEFAEVYVNDKYNMDMREWFEQANPTSLAQMIERMLEAERKEYWQTDEATLKRLTEVYLEIASQHDVLTDNEKFNERLKTLAEGYGLSLANVPAFETPANAAAPEQVTGQKLEQVQQAAESDIQWDRWGLMLLLLLAFLAGAFYQHQSSTRDMKPMLG